MLGEDSLNPFQLFPALAKLSKRGEPVKVLRYVRIINRTVMLCHFKCAVSQQLLEGKGIATTINQILSGKCMPKLTVTSEMPRDVCEMINDS